MTGGWYQSAFLPLRVFFRRRNSPRETTAAFHVFWTMDNSYSSCSRALGQPDFLLIRLVHLPPETLLLFIWLFFNINILLYSIQRCSITFPLVLTGVKGVFV